MAFAEFFHPEATSYTNATGTFFVGRDNIKNNFLIPVFAGVRTAKIDFNLFRFSVISPTTIVSYGRLQTTNSVQRAVMAG